MKLNSIFVCENVCFWFIFINFFPCWRWIQQFTGQNTHLFGSLKFLIGFTCFLFKIEYKVMYISIEWVLLENCKEYFVFTSFLFHFYFWLNWKCCTFHLVYVNFPFDLKKSHTNEMKSFFVPLKVPWGPMELNKGWYTIQKKKATRVHNNTFLS